MTLMQNSLSQSLKSKGQIFDVPWNTIAIAPRYCVQLLLLHFPGIFQDLFYLYESSQYSLFLGAAHRHITGIKQFVLRHYQKQIKLLNSLQGSVSPIRAFEKFQNFSSC